MWTYLVGGQLHRRLPTSNSVDFPRSHHRCRSEYPSDEYHRAATHVSSTAYLTRGRRRSTRVRSRVGSPASTLTISTRETKRREMEATGMRVSHNHQQPEAKNANKGFKAAKLGKTRPLSLSTINDADLLSLVHSVAGPQANETEPPPT